MTKRFVIDGEVFENESDYWYYLERFHSEMDNPYAKKHQETPVKSESFIDRIVRLEMENKELKDKNKELTKALTTSRKLRLFSELNDFLTNFPTPYSLFKPLCVVFRVNKQREDRYFIEHYSVSCQSTKELVQGIGIYASDRQDWYCGKSRPLSDFLNYERRFNGKAGFDESFRADYYPVGWLFVDELIFINGYEA